MKHPIRLGPLSRRRRRLARGPLRAYFADQAGAIAVLAAVIFPVVIGGIGLGVETSFWYMSERKLQHAADLAAHAGSARLRAGDGADKIQAVATNIAVNSGFIINQGTVTVSIPPTSGTYAGDSNSVEVVLAENWPRWFTALFGVGPITLSARAVSRIQGGANACVLALSSSAPGAVTVSGSTNVVLEGCDVASNSVTSTSFLMSGDTATISTGCVYTVGQSSVTAGLQLTTCQSVRENSPVARDPYRKVAEPQVTGSCIDGKVGSPTLATTLTPTEDHPSGVKAMRFCSGLDLKGQVTFQPGLYIIEGDLTINGGDPNSASTAQMFGEGVTFYIAGSGKLVLNGKVSLDLAAPTSGPYSGLLFFGARSAAVTHKINGTSGSTLQGAIYAAGSAIEFTGNSEVTNGCTQVIGATVTMTGNSTLRSDCAAAGTQPILANEGLTIVD